MDRWWKILLTPRSPFLIAGRRMTDNDYETLDYIPARILKAAVARAIVESYGGTPEDGSAVRYWVGPELDVSRCRPEWRHWVKSFSDILFSDAVPFGASRASSTLLVCKKDKSHPPIDDLPHRFRSRSEMASPEILPGAIKDRSLKCCECGSRFERWKDGWRLPPVHGRKGAVAHVQKRVFTRVELDDWRQTHRDAHLFSLAVGIPAAVVEADVRPLVFEGWIRAPEGVDLVLPQGTELRVGAYLGTGLGRMGIEVVPENSRDRERWTDLRDWETETGETATIPLILQTEALYAVGSGQKHPTSIEEDLNRYADWWKQRPSPIPAPRSLKVSYASIQYESRYPFLAGQPGIRSAEPLWYWLGGSLFVFSVADPAEKEILFQWATSIILNGVRSDVSVEGIREGGREGLESVVNGVETTWTPVRMWSAENRSDKQ
ncbi:hypothetical protein CVV65_13445 [Kyrpidia spormannii]|uniref:Uncharacterized protein n=1 Tax=Kyrpidia spormannii TaxID=2055160 RepID=A0A2K8N9L2_9BACL|nr:hypothetical protein [Kyrpidia spormannii]ATY85805.1 hypothetical protein CVV65_13445 [Kyrpidia spormannii]